MRVMSIADPAPGRYLNASGLTFVLFLVLVVLDPGGKFTRGAGEEAGGWRSFRIGDEQENEDDRSYSPTP